MALEGSELSKKALYEKRSESQNLSGQDDIHYLRQLASLASARRPILLYTIK